MVRSHTSCPMSCLLGVVLVDFWGFLDGVFVGFLGRIFVEFLWGFWVEFLWGFWVEFLWGFCELFGVFFEEWLWKKMLFLGWLW